MDHKHNHKSNWSSNPNPASHYDIVHCIFFQAMILIVFSLTGVYRSASCKCKHLIVA